MMGFAMTDRKSILDETEKGQHCAGLFRPEDLNLDSSTQEVSPFSNILPTKSTPQIEKDTIISNRGRGHAKKRSMETGEDTRRTLLLKRRLRGTAVVTVYDTCSANKVMHFKPDGWSLFKKDH